MDMIDDIIMACARAISDSGLYTAWPRFHSHKLNVYHNKYVSKPSYGPWSSTDTQVCDSIHFYEDYLELPPAAGIPGKCIPYADPDLFDLLLIQLERY